MDSQFLTDALTAEELEHIVTDVLGVLEVHADGAADASGGGSAASVVIHGPRDLILVVQADPAAAAAVATAFFDEDSVEDDREDAMRELANVCAGATKTMLEGEWTIGIPTAGVTDIASDSIHAVAHVGGGEIQISLGSAARTIA